MLHPLLALGLAVAVAVGVARPAAAIPPSVADSLERYVPVTDPDLLRRLGLQPDATNVYGTERALRNLTMAASEQKALRAGAADREPYSAFGTAGWGYAPVGFPDFLPANTFFDPHGWSTQGGGRLCTAGTSLYTASIDSMPHGARLWYVAFWLWDESPENITVTLTKICHQDEGPGEFAVFLLDAVSTTDSAGREFLRMGLCTPPCSGIDETIDLQSCHYYLTAQLDDEFTCSEGSDLRIEKARAEWRRQVSPPPSTATFDDVPTGHQFFRHIEALAASGITGGCGAGKYCPGAPLTRGQMAAFLAKALGLHWQEISQP